MQLFAICKWLFYAFCKPKFFIVVRLITFFLLVVFMQFRAAAFSQEKITLSRVNAPLVSVLKDVRKQTGYNFLYSEKVSTISQPVTVALKNATIEDCLSQLFKNQPLDYNIVDKTVIIKIKAQTKISTQDQKDSFVSTAPPILITGVVSNEKGETLIGVTIKLKGTNIAISTNVKGEYSIRVPDENAVLIFSYVGFTTLEVSAKNASKVILKENNSKLDEIVVVGYGTQKKATNTGAQSSMSGKLLVQSPAANISNSLVGRLPGLFASQASGEPGNDQSTLRIRGVGTFNGNQQPLVLVDGIQVDNYNNIDPNEIENITILKDASSTAVYGIRGANGVLIITTKRGKVGPPKISYTFNQAINSFTAIRSQMNSFDWATSFNQASKNDAYTTNSTYTPTYSQSDLDKYKSGSDPIFYPSVDWYKVFLKDYSGQQQHNLNINGGTEKVRYAISTGYFNQEGLFKNTTLSPGYDAQVRYKRYNLRSNLNYNITDKFKASVDISSQIENRSGNALNTQTVIESIARANPTIAPGIIDNKVVILSTGTPSPLTSLYQSGYQREYRGYLNGSIRLDYDLDFITKGLTTHANISYQNFNSQRFLNGKSTTYTIIPYLAVRQADGSVAYLPQQEDVPFNQSETITKNRRLTAEVALDYKRQFGNHNVSGLLLYNQQKTNDPTYTFIVPTGYQSYVGRGTYDYKGRYLAEVDVAYNGTENFAPGNRFGLFPAYSLGWVASEEPFFPKEAFITLLKFRGSYGEVGNDQIGSNFLTSDNRFLYRPTAWTFTGGYRFGEVGSTYNVLTGSREGRSSNPDLTWERAVKSNLGIEMAFWKNNISLSVDLFSEMRDNILSLPQTVPGSYGAAIPASNLGKMQNRGFELDFTLNDKIGKFNYQVKANYSFARNKILYQDEVNRVYPYQYRTGNRFGQYFGLINEGFYNTWDEINDPKRPVTLWNNNRLQPGDLKFKDVNNDGKIDDDDQVPIGYSQIPEITYGISLLGQYKGFSLSVLFQGAGHVSLNYTRRFTQGFFDTPAAGAVDYLINSWSQERYDAGLPINFPRLSKASTSTPQNNYQSSDFFTVDASYLRVKNIELGYSFSGQFLKKIGLTSTRVFINGNNLYTWSNVFKGVDPENPPTNTGLEPYPLVRTINLGVNINF